MALIQTMTKIPDTYEELAVHLLKMIPSGYRRVDIVADSYIKHSIKKKLNVLSEENIKKL